MPASQTRPKADIALERVEELRRDMTVLSTRVTSLEEKLNRLATLPDDIQELSAVTNKLSASLDSINPETLNDQVGRIILLIDGDPTKDVVGLRTRVRTIEIQTTAIVEERNRLKWILVGLSLTGIANLSAILTVIAKSLGVGQ